MTRSDTQEEGPQRLPNQIHITYIDGGLNAVLHTRAFNSHMRLNAQQVLHVLSQLRWLHLLGYFQLEVSPQFFGQRQAFRKQI